MTAVSEVFRRMYAGEVSPEAAAAEVAALTAAGAGVSAHEVAAGEADAVAAEPSDGQPFNPYLGLAGDPTPEEYARLTVAQMLELEVVRPGLSQRMERAGVWRRESLAEAQRAQAQADRAFEAERFRTDPEFAASEMRKRARGELDSKWWFIPVAERERLAAEAGITSEDFASLADAKARVAAGYAPSETRVGR